MSKVLKFGDEAFVVNGLLSPAECKSLIREAETLGFQESKIISDGKEVVAKEIRNNDRVILDSFEIANMLWGKAEEFLPEELDGCKVIGSNERIHFYRYEPRQSFRGHRDFPYQPRGEKSKLSLIVYLNE